MLPTRRTTCSKEGQKMEKNQLILSVKDLNIKFNLRGKVLHAIRGIDLDIYHGEVLAIVGESGCGKSVLCKSILHLLPPSARRKSGTIAVNGRDITQLRERELQKLRGSLFSMVFQDPMTSLNPIITIGKQITSVIMKHQDVSEVEARAQALELMEKVGIPNAEQRFDDYPFQYSGGMRQRIVIAIALSCRPKILICDEPTTALDVTIQAQILKLIKDLQKEYNYTIVFITHDLGVVANIADRVADPVSYTHLTLPTT